MTLNDYMQYESISERKLRLFNDIYLHMHVIYIAHSIGLQVIENSLPHYLNDNHAAK